MLVSFEKDNLLNNEVPQKNSVKDHVEEVCKIHIVKHYYSLNDFEGIVKSFIFDSLVAFYRVKGIIFLESIVKEIVIFS